jgi:hypothetical protein
MADKNRQREFIVRHTDVITSLYPMKTASSNSIKNNFVYFLNIADNLVKERVGKKYLRLHLL